jgi:hypothetical protein
MSAKITAVLCFFLFLCKCADKNPAGPVVPAAEINYGDTLSAGLRYQSVPDTAAARESAVEITLILRNLTGRSLLLDSTSRGTYISVTQDVIAGYLWVWPDVLPSVDTLVRKVTLNAGDSLFFRGRWLRLDSYRRPAPLGRYLFEGTIFGLGAGQVYFESL